MNLFVPLRRATLLIPSGPKHDHDRNHLFILITEPTSSKDQVLLVSISSKQTNIPFDPTCILHQGDHPFIRRDSYVVYDKSRIESAAKIINGVNQGLFIPQNAMDIGVFDRICAGIEHSRLTSPKTLSFYQSRKETPSTDFLHEINLT